MNSILARSTAVTFEYIVTVFVLVVVLAYFFGSFRTFLEFSIPRPKFQRLVSLSTLFPLPSFRYTSRASLLAASILHPCSSSLIAIASAISCLNPLHVLILERFLRVFFVVFLHVIYYGIPVLESPTLVTWSPLCFFLRFPAVSCLQGPIAPMAKTNDLSNAVQNQ